MVYKSCYYIFYKSYYYFLFVKIENKCLLIYIYKRISIMSLKLLSKTSKFKVINFFNSFFFSKKFKSISFKI